MRSHAPPSELRMHFHFSNCFFFSQIRETFPTAAQIFPVRVAEKHSKHC